MDAVWNEIIEEYNTARQCLWCPKHSGNWSRKENEGYYHLWRAYHLAHASETKQSLWYARVLFMMASEQRYKQSDYVVLNSYLRPCMVAYAEAKQSGDAPTNEEYENAKFLYDYFAHVEANTASTEEITERAYSYIEGFTSDINFQFHDSKIIGFSHDCTSAQLHLQYDETIVTILFEEIYEIEVNSVDPEVTWISDFDCYPTFHNADLLIFDVGFYKIMCKKIKLVEE